MSEIWLWVSIILFVVFAVCLILYRFRSPNKKILNFGFIALALSLSFFFLNWSLSMHDYLLMGLMGLLAGSIILFLIAYFKFKNRRYVMYILVGVGVFLLGLFFVYGSALISLYLPLDKYNFDIQAESFQIRDFEMYYDYGTHEGRISFRISNLIGAKSSISIELSSQLEVTGFVPEDKEFNGIGSNVATMNFGDREIDDIKGDYTVYFKKGETSEYIPNGMFIFTITAKSLTFKHIPEPYAGEFSLFFSLGKYECSQLCYVPFPNRSTIPATPHFDNDEFRLRIRGHELTGTKSHHFILHTIDSSLKFKKDVMLYLGIGLIVVFIQIFSLELLKARKQAGQNNDERSSRRRLYEAIVNAETEDIAEIPYIKSRALEVHEYARSKLRRRD